MKPKTALKFGIIIFIVNIALIVIDILMANVKESSFGDFYLNFTILYDEAFYPILLLFILIYVSLIWQAIQEKKTRLALIILAVLVILINFILISP